MYFSSPSENKCSLAKCVWGLFFIIGVVLVVISSVGIYASTHTWIVTQCNVTGLAKCGVLQGHEGNEVGLWFEMIVNYPECSQDSLVRVDITGSAVATEWHNNCHAYFNYYWANSTSSYKCWYSEYDDCAAQWNSPFYEKTNKNDQDDSLALAGWITVLVIGCLFALSPIWAAIVEIKCGHRLAKHGLTYEPL